MPRKGFRPEEIIAKLRGADVLLGQGKRVAEVVEALGVSEVKLRDELLDRGIFRSLREARVLIEARRRHCNTVRPHSASATGRRRPRPRLGRGRHRRDRYVRPLVMAPMSCITEAAPGPAKRGRSRRSRPGYGPAGGLAWIIHEEGHREGRRRFSNWDRSPCPAAAGATMAGKPALSPLRHAW